MKRWVILIVTFVCCLSYSAGEAFGRDREPLPPPTDTLYTRTLSDMAFDHYMKGDLEAALDCYRKICEVAPRLRDTARWSAALSSMGAIYRRKRMPDSCLVCYKEALRLVEHTYDYAVQSNLLSKIALHYVSNGRPEKADSVADKAVDVAHKSGELKAIMFASYAGSSICFRNGAYAKGIRVMQNLVEEAKRKKQPQYMLRGYRVMLQMFDRRGLRDSVNYYMSQTDSTLNTMPVYMRETALVLEQQAVIYTKYGNFRKSLEVYRKLLRHQGGGNLTMDKIYLGMARNYSSMRDYLRAMKYYNQAIKAGDSLHVVSLSRQDSVFNARIVERDEALAESEGQQDLLRQEIHSLRRILYAIVAIAGLMIGGLLYLYGRNASK